MAIKKSIMNYLAPPLQFEWLILTVPEVVLENEKYNLLINTQFLIEFNGIVNHHESFLLLIGYWVRVAPLMQPLHIF